jgi:hypothetical protein
MSTLLSFLLPLLFFIPFAIYAARRRGVLVEEWSAAGQRLGIGAYTSVGSAGGLQGTLQGLPVRVYWEQRGSGKHRYTVTVFQVELGADAPIGLIISNEWMFAKASKLIGAQDIQIGDDVFDKTFMIKAMDEHETRAYFGPAHRREALLELRSLNSRGYGITNGFLFSELHNMVNGATLEAHLTQLVALAQRHIHGNEAGAW